MKIKSDQTHTFLMSSRFVISGESPPCTHRNCWFIRAARGRQSKASIHASYTLSEYLILPVIGGNRGRRKKTTTCQVKQSCSFILGRCFGWGWKRLLTLPTNLPNTEKHNFTVNLAFIFPSIPPQSGRNRPDIRLNVKGEYLTGTGTMNWDFKTLNGQFCAYEVGLHCSSYKKTVSYLRPFFELY